MNYNNYKYLYRLYDKVALTGAIFRRGKKESGYMAKGLQEVRVAVVGIDSIHTKLTELTQSLRNKGYTVQILDEIHYTTTLTGTLLPDILLIDNTISEEDAQILKTLLENADPCGGVPVILLGSPSESFSGAKLLSSLAHDIISKPYQVERVLSRIEMHLELAYLRNELKRAKHLQGNHYSRRRWGKSPKPLTQEQNDY